jgi:hypothetical protein
MTRYKAPPAWEQSSIPAGRLAIVLADARSGCFSPALSCSLSVAGPPTELANLRDAWIEALVEHGIEPLRAAMFVQREVLRTQASLQGAGSLVAGNLEAAA